jgi:hypothetical protein
MWTKYIYIVHICKLVCTYIGTSMYVYTRVSTWCGMGWVGMLGVSCYVYCIDIFEKGGVLAKNVLVNKHC